MKTRNFYIVTRCGDCGSRDEFWRASAYAVNLRLPYGKCYNCGSRNLRIKKQKRFLK